MHHSSNTFVNVPCLLLREMQNVECIMCKFHVFIVINRWHRCFSLTDKVIVINVFRQETFFLQLRDSLLKHLVEDVVGSLNFLLKCDARFFQKVCLNVTASQLSLDIEVNPDEFSLKIG